MELELELELELEEELLPPMPGKMPPPQAVSVVLTAPKIAKRMASVLTLLNLVTDIAINSQEDIVVVLGTHSHRESFRPLRVIS